MKFKYHFRGVSCIDVRRKDVRCKTYNCLTSIHQTSPPINLLILETNKMLHPLFMK